MPFRISLDPKVQEMIFLGGGGSWQKEFIFKTFSNDVNFSMSIERIGVISMAKIGIHILDLL